jgi:hypothetical protein
MVYHQSLAWGVNYGFRSYLDATIAHAVFKMLPPQSRKVEGIQLLKSSISMNPYHFLIVNSAQDAASSIQEQIQFWNQFAATLSSAANKPGCPTEGLYKKSVKSRMFARIASFPVPKKEQSARKILSFLEDLKCDNQQILDTYRRALNEG